MVMMLAPKKVQVQKTHAPKSQAQTHHQDKPEAGQPSATTPKPLPRSAKPRAKESTTVGSK